MSSNKVNETNLNISSQVNRSPATIADVTQAPADCKDETLGLRSSEKGHDSSMFSQNINDHHFEKASEKGGSAKILPPKTLTPPCTVDVDKLNSTPRVQRPNELPATPNVKLSFLNQVVNFWELQGSSLKIPVVDRKSVDLYTLHRIVQEEGGVEQTTKKRKWSKVAHRMQYPSGKNIGAILKGHYERILHPFEIYTTGKVINKKKKRKYESHHKDYKPQGVVSSVKTEVEGEKKNITILGARPCNSPFIRPATPDPIIVNDPLAKTFRRISNRGKTEEAMPLSEGCDDSYTPFCLLLPLHDILKRNRRLARCVIEEVSKPTEAIGFEQAEPKDTFKQFGDMADQFKADYFRRPDHGFRLHDELVCKMALNPDRLNLDIANICHESLVDISNSETKLRKSLLEWGVTKMEREVFENIPDDERQCEVCKTTCFLSAVSCQCTKQIVCLCHFSELCECKAENHSLRYRYTLEEMLLMLKELHFKIWLAKCCAVFDTPSLAKKITLEDLQKLALEGKRNKFSNSLQIGWLNSATLEAKKCVKFIQQLDINKVRTRTRHSNDSTKCKLTMNGLELLVKEIDDLRCVIKEGQSVRDLLEIGKSFVASAEDLLSKELNKTNEKAIGKLINEGSLLCIELHEIKNLRIRFEQVNWYKRSRRFRNATNILKLADVNRYIKEGQTLIPHPLIEKEISILQGIAISAGSWEKAAKACFQANSQHDLPEVELLLKAADKIKVKVPTKPKLKLALRRAENWLNFVKILEKKKHYPYYRTLESVANRGLNIPLKLEKLDRIKKDLDAARKWKDKTAKAFLRKHSQSTLLDVLSPRISALIIGKTSVKRTPLEEQFTENLSPAQVVNAFQKAEEEEIREIRELRRVNTNRNPIEDKFCFCKGKIAGAMYLCQLCLDWFHAECVPAMPFKETAQGSTPMKSTKYLCPSCMRSRRPRLEAILSLIVSLQRLPIRLPEGEALQCLAERALNWRDRARQAFATEDVTAVLATLSKISDSNVRDTIEQNIESIRPQTANQVEIEIEHVYSVPTVALSSVQALNTESLTKSPTSKQLTSPVVIELKKSTRELLENLMMEGDLLEVSLDETNHLWKILSTAKSLNNDLTAVQQMCKIFPMACESKETMHFGSTARASKKRQNIDSTINLPAKRPWEGPKGNRKASTKRDKKKYKDPTITEAERPGDCEILKVSSCGDTANIQKGKHAAKSLTKHDLFSDTSTSNEYNEEECGAQKCRKPSGRLVDWVQCDGRCNKWFHMLCLGLNRKLIKPDDDYICKQCMK